MPVEIALLPSPSEAEREAILRPLRAYNLAQAGPSGHEQFALMLRDTESGESLGGLWGRLSYGWLFVELLGIPDTLRGQGHGTRLLARAEEIARQRGCTGIWLDTYSFQAPGFYLKQGFEQFGRLEDHPRGEARLFFRKRLADPPSGAVDAGTDDATDDATLALLRATGTATLTTQMFKRGFRNVFLRGVRPLAPPRGTVAGPAMTMRFIPAREDLDRMEALANPENPQRKAVNTIPPGHVLVMDCRGEAEVACAGQILVQRLQVRGAAALVADGGIRDAGPIAAMDLPVFCAGPAAPLNLVAHHPVEIDGPVACGGVAVYPGDIVVGDADGVVAIPRHLAAEVARDAAAQEELEAFLLARIAGGAGLPGTYPPDEATRAAYAAWREARRKG